jgi:endogenous inhibitor of DNA gyrase (YacG/DUF329 family)
MSGSCPICRRGVEADAPSRPFCSPRCKLVDLGNWLDGSYRVPGRPADPEEIVEAVKAERTGEPGDLPS